MAAAWDTPDKVPALTIAKHAVRQHFGHPLPEYGPCTAFALTDMNGTAQMLRDAGFADVETELFPVAYDFATADDYIRYRTDVTGPLWDTMDTGPQAEKQAAFAAIKAGAGTAPAGEWLLSTGEPGLPHIRPQSAVMTGVGGEGMPTTAQLLRTLRDQAGLPMEQSVALPPALYADEGIYRLELERIFARAWNCVGRAADFAGPGRYLAAEIAGEPVIVIGDEAGGIRAFSNICRHRGARLLEGAGDVRRIVCPYHAWTYDLTGQLKRFTFMGG